MREIIERDGNRTTIDVKNVVAFRECGIDEHSEIVMNGGAIVVVNIPYDKCFDALYGVMG